MKLEKHLKVSRKGSCDVFFFSDLLLLQVEQDLLPAPCFSQAKRSLQQNKSLSNTSPCANANKCRHLPADFVSQSKSWSELISPSFFLGREPLQKSETSLKAFVFKGRINVISIFEGKQIGNVNA